MCSSGESDYDRQGELPDLIYLGRLSPSRAPGTDPGGEESLLTATGVCDFPQSQWADGSPREALARCGAFWSFLDAVWACSRQGLSPGCLPSPTEASV